MIRFKSMAWSHAFSYGPKNTIDFLENPLVQLVGKNGYGKSSIALILEEVLYNKNSKGVKKANILNRYSRSKTYSITLYFDKDNDEYIIDTVRGSTQTVKLMCNGKDISAHTSTATYKQIENIIGYDHKTFCQIVYQSNAFSLEFLTATDTNRKKFLIDLLNLNRYTEIADKVKVDLKGVAQEAELINMKLTSIRSWLSKYKPEDLVSKQLLQVPASPIEEQEELAKLEEVLRTLEQTNKKITLNNKYKEILAGICVEMLPAPTTDILTLKVRESEISSKITKVNGVISGVGPILTNCPACGQSVDHSHKATMINEARAQLPALKHILEDVKAAITTANIEKTKYDKSLQNIQEWEKYSTLVDNTMPSELLDEISIKHKVQNIRLNINTTNALIASSNKFNVEAEAHNAKCGVILDQIAEMHKDLKTQEQKLAVISIKMANLQILVKTFSPSGFVAYKIESLVKDLEELTNEYLAELSGGRFQLGFRISSSDKLDVIITDNGEDIDIFALSNGELARVNVSTLLAIRKLLQSLSNVRTNLLILDETVENLDVDGKEKLIEVLLGEEHLNTVLVSHGFSHPLLAKLEIVKEDNMSRIEK